MTLNYKGRILVFFLSLVLVDVVLLLVENGLHDTFVFPKWFVLSKNLLVVLVFVLMKWKENFFNYWVRISLVAVLFLAFGIESYIDGCKAEIHEPLIWEGTGSFFSCLFPVTGLGMNLGWKLSGGGIHLEFFSGIVLGAIYYFVVGVIFEKILPREMKANK
jgi:hypothetical protein